MHRIRTPNHALRAARQARGLSLRELAYFVHCSHAAIQQLENGTIQGSASLKARISRALQTPLEELWPAPPHIEP